MADLRSELVDRYQAAVRATGPEFAALLRAAAPLDTGDLRRSITVTTAGLTTRVDIPVQYATFTTEGTRAHEIRARKAKVLAFYWEKVGRMVFTPRVFHPGTRPNPWYANSVAAWSRLVERNFR